MLIVDDLTDPVHNEAHFPYMILNNVANLNEKRRMMPEKPVSVR